MTSTSGAGGAGTLTYDSHGKPGTSNTGRFQYTGQMYIEEIDLYYYKARFYSADLKRFLQTDPIGYGDGLNMYGYVGGDSINMTDPSGLAAEEPCDEDPSGFCPVVVAPQTTESECEGICINPGSEAFRQLREMFGGGIPGGVYVNPCAEGEDCVVVTGARRTPRRRVVREASNFSCAAIRGGMVMHNTQFQGLRGVVRATGADPDNGTFLFQGNFDAMGPRSRNLGGGYDVGAYVRGDLSDYGTFSSLTIGGVGIDTDIGVSVLYVNSTDFSGLGGTFEGGLGLVDVFGPIPMQGRPVTVGLGVSVPPGGGVNLSLMQLTGSQSCGQ